MYMPFIGSTGQLTHVFVPTFGDNVVGDKNVLVDGAVIASDFRGIGTQITNINGNNIIAGTVREQELAESSVGTTRIATGAVTDVKLASESVSTGKLQDSSVTTTKLSDASVTTPKLENISITTTKIADSAVTSDKIADDAVTPSKIPTASITGDKIQDFSIPINKLESLELTTDQIADNSISEQKITRNSIRGSASDALGDDIGTLALYTIHNDNIRNSTIIASDKLTDGSISTNKIATNAITVDKLASDVTLQAITVGGAETDRAVYISNVTPSTSTTTGAFRVLGGVGVAGNVHAGFFHGDGSNLTGISSTLQAITVGGPETDRAVYISNVTPSTSTTTGAFRVLGGVGVVGNVHAGFFHGDGSNLTGIDLQTILTHGNSSSEMLVITNAEDTTAELTGAVQVAGGLYVAKNIWTNKDLIVTGNLFVNGNTTTINSTSLTVQDRIIQIGVGNDNATKDIGILLGKTPSSNIAIYYDVSDPKLKIGLTLNGALDDTITLNPDKLNLDINGGVYADSFHGDGSNLTTLNGGNISNGTIGGDQIVDESITLAKLNSDVTLAGVTGHGATTSDIVSFTNTTDAASGVGAVKITGGLYVAKKIYAGDDITAFSDRRKKSNIERIENALDKVSQLNGYTFDYNGERKTGVIAQEVNEVLPEAVYGSEDTTYSVAYGNLVGILIEAIKELKNEINQLKNT